MVIALSLQSDLVTDMYIPLSSILSAKRVRRAHRLEARVFGQPGADVPGRYGGKKSIRTKVDGELDMKKYFFMSKNPEKRRKKN